MRRTESLKTWLPVLAMLLAAIPVYAQNNPPSPASQNPFAGNEQAVAEGREVFNRTCTACHGFDGAQGERAPALATLGRRYQRNTDAQIFDAIEHGIPGTQMPALGLPESDAWKVAAFLRSLRALAIEMPAAGDVAHGEEIFWNKGGCGACHMVRGKGGLTGPDLTNIASQLRLISIRDALTDPDYKVRGGGAGLRPSTRYQEVHIVTRDGQKISGVVLNEDSFSMQILGADNGLHLFPRDELREVQYDAKRPMPSDYAQRLTPGEMQDLLAFLSRQGTAPAARSRNGSAP